MPKVQMPQLGESVAEGTIGKWLKKPGDHVDKYEPIVEVITDKVNAEVPSPYEGTLTEILVQEGETVPNNTEIAVIEGRGVRSTDRRQPRRRPRSSAEAAPARPVGPYGAGTGPGGSDEGPADAPRPPAPSPSPERMPAPPAAVATAEKRPFQRPATAASAVDAYEGRMTPAVRRLAREHGVDLALIAGTGHSGRVTREDVEKFVDLQKAAHRADRASSSRRRRLPQLATQAPAAAPRPRRRPCRQPPRTTRSSQASPMRKAIAAQMTASLAVPVAYTIVEVDMSGVVALRDANKGAYQAQRGHRPDLRRIRGQGDGRGAAPPSGLQRPLHRRGPLATPPRQPGRRRGGRGWAGRAGHPRRRPPVDPRPQPRDPRPCRSRPRRQAEAGRHPRRNVHARQHGLDRLDHHGADHQRAAKWAS